MNDLKKYSLALSEFALTAKVEDTDQFAQILVANGLALQANTIIEEARKLALAEIDKKKVLIRSAQKLTGEEKLEIIKNIEAKYGGGLTFEEVVDESLIGGTVVEMRGTKIDASISGKIKKLAQHLL